MHNLGGDWATDAAQPGWVYARIGSMTVGRLYYDADGFVGHVAVGADFRRRGIATAMLDAMPLRPSLPPSHEDSGNTPDGNAWVAAMQARSRQIRSN